MDAPILGQVALSYSPVIDLKRRIVATRLSVFPLQPGKWLPVAELLNTLGAICPPDGLQLALSVRSEGVLAELLTVQPNPNLLIEVPKFMAGDPQHRDAIKTLATNGNALLLSGRPDHPLPKDILPCFRYSIIDVADERRALGDKAPPPGVKRSIGFWQEGVHSRADMDAAFGRGAIAVVGWPLQSPPKEEPPERPTLRGLRAPAGGRSSLDNSRPELSAIIQLINQVEDEVPLSDLEATLKRDPTLAFKLMRYINSPLFGLRTEISSFGHAVMLLGYQRLKRWLALLLVTAGDDANQRPLMYAALRRGLMMEALAIEMGDEDHKGDMFICGIFSLLDRMLNKPFDALLQSIPVVDQVEQALLGTGGPYQHALDLVRATEGGFGLDIREQAEASLLDMRRVNRALLHALGGAQQLM
ncbi:MAG TPA: HDOD domain-containing protein [Burkholderiaceae bacterium]|nr:HDOD domain-containing protein [Burkholderiaceae bacterium]HMX09706.1 HDOD domain-containing protein [Burkholderiaceae bacterium]HMY99739.1 HDOD domain-containing protein [Burkholderiaceae bacterium]HNB44516.1 HDOD domain-containing protein [Burkholderiaceae bacterium]HNG78237.1 HDOD domain-containing protein [Burkholderiaceae bacterium]